MSEPTVNPVQHLQPYRENSWDKIGVASAANGADMIALLRHYEKHAFFPGDVHPSVGYHTSTSSLADPVRMATISIKDGKSLHVGLGHSYLIAPYGSVPYGRKPTTVDIIEEARQILHQFNVDGTLEYTFKLPNGRGSHDTRIVLVVQEIDKLLDLAAIDLIQQSIATPRRNGLGSGLEKRI